MKKIFVLSIAFFSIALLKGQEHERKGLFSITGGYTYCTLNGSNLETDWRSSFHVGFRKDVQISESTFLNTGFLYNVTGCLIKREFTDDNFKLHSLQFPIGVKKYVGQSVFLTAGCSVNLRLDAQVNKDPLPGETRLLDIAASIGAGFNVKRFVVDFRWNYGFIDIRRDDGRISGHNQYVMAGLAYRLTKNN